MKNYFILLVVSFLTVSCGKKERVDFPTFKTSEELYLPYVDEFVEDCKKYIEPETCEKSYEVPINTVTREKMIELGRISALGVSFTYKGRSEVYVLDKMASGNKINLRSLIYHELYHSYPFFGKHRGSSIFASFASSIMWPFQFYTPPNAWDLYVEELFTNDRSVRGELYGHFGKEELFNREVASREDMSIREGQLILSESIPVNFCDH